METLKNKGDAKAVRAAQTTCRLMNALFDHQLLSVSEADLELDYHFRFATSPGSPSIEGHPKPSRDLCRGVSDF